MIWADMYVTTLSVETVVISCIDILLYCKSAENDFSTAIDIDQVRTAEERALRDASDRVIKSRIKELEIVTVDGMVLF